jgi:hypothetical protein
VTDERCSGAPTIFAVAQAVPNRPLLTFLVPFLTSFNWNMSKTDTTKLAEVRNTRFSTVVFKL